MEFIFIVVQIITYSLITLFIVGSHKKLSKQLKQMDRYMVEKLEFSKKREQKTIDFVERILKKCERLLKR